MSLYNFLNEPITGYCRFTLIIAEPGGGKTHLMNNVLKYYLENNSFDEYHLVLPSFKNEANDSYSYLRDNKYAKYVFIYSEFHPKISENLFKEQDVDNPEKKIFFWIDDSTGEQDLFKDTYMRKIAIKTRHLRIATYIIAHSECAGVIEPKVRGQAQFIYLGAMHRFILEKCFKSYVNLPKAFPNFKTFVKFMDDEVYSQKYGMLFVDKINNQCNPDVSTWFAE